MSLEQRLEQLRQFRDIDPGNARISADIAVTLCRLHRYAEAQDCLDKTNSSDEAQQALTYAQGLVHLGEARFLDADSLFSDLLKTGDTSDAVRYHGARAAALLGDYARADALLALPPQQSWADWPLLQARIKHQLGDAEAALTLLEADENPASAEREGLKALICHDLERDDEAGQYARTALQLDSTCGDALLVQASLNLAVGELPQALETLEHLIARQPERGRPHLVLGLARMMQGRFAEAATALQVGIDRIPREIEYRMALAWSCLVAGDVEGARVAVNAMLSLAPDTDDLQGLAAIVDLLDGNVPAAEARLGGLQGLAQEDDLAQVAGLLLQSLRAPDASPERLQAAFRLVASRPELIEALVQRALGRGADDKGPGA